MWSVFAVRMCCKIDQVYDFDAHQNKAAPEAKNLKQA